MICVVASTYFVHRMGPFFSGDFNGEGKFDVALCNQLDSNWWVGLSDGNAIDWHLAGNTKGFGNLIR